MTSVPSEKGPIRMPLRPRAYQGFMLPGKGRRKGACLYKGALLKEIKQKTQLWYFSGQILQ